MGLDTRVPHLPDVPAGGIGIIMAKRIGFVLCSSVANAIPSTRVAVLNMLPFLRAAGMEPVILFEPPEPTETPDLTGVATRVFDAGCDLVVFQKVHGASALSLAQQLTAVGIRTVYAVCDLVNVPMVQATDATIIVTAYLKSLYPLPLQERIHVVHDGIENPDAYKRDWGTASGTKHKPLHAALVTSTNLHGLPVIGHPPPWLSVRIVGRYHLGLRRWREAYWKWAELPYRDRLRFMRFLTDRKIVCVPWDAIGVYTEMMQADMGIIPIQTPLDSAGNVTPLPWQVKSENRLTLKMSMGLPVIATPIPSYEDVIQHGVNGFFARTASDWNSCLTALRDPARRHAIGLAARASVAHKYSMQEQAEKLIKVLVPRPD